MFFHPKSAEQLRKSWHWGDPSYQWHCTLVHIKVRIIIFPLHRFTLLLSAFLPAMPLTVSYQGGGVNAWSIRFVSELLIWPKDGTLVSRTQPSGLLCLWQCYCCETFFCQAISTIDDQKNLQTEKLLSHHPTKWPQPLIRSAPKVAPLVCACTPKPEAEHGVVDGRLL